MYQCVTLEVAFTLKILCEFDKFKACPTEPLIVLCLGVRLMRDN